jgi:endonuclease YncB( thermonuclease family)
MVFNIAEMIRSTALRLAAVVLAAFLVLVSPSWAGEVTTYTGRASMIDGDSVEIHGKRIRLYGIDAVESGQQCQKDGKPWLCGKDSAFALADKIGEKPIICSGDEFDRYRRPTGRRGTGLR